MPEHRKIGILGGDRRMLAAAAGLAEEYECAVWGFDAVCHTTGEKYLRNCVRCADPESAVRGSCAVVLPLPCSSGEDRLNCPLAKDGGEVPLSGIPAWMESGSLLCGGMLPRRLRKLAEEYGVRTADYYDAEELQILNAVPTAEGAVAACMREIPETVRGMKTAVFGYGRVGRTLASHLRAWGADVTAAARSRRDLSWAETDGCTPVSLERYCADPPAVRAIFNTVPSRILGAETLGRLDRETVLFELASGEGGIDREAADALGIRVVPLPSLPGKTSPVTAGEIICRTVRELLREHREGGR